MQYRRFGRTNMLLSQISLGCMRFPGASPEDDENAIRTVERAVALGINHIETGEFESSNVHYYFFYQGLRHVVERAAARDMGVFIISPSAQGGRLHQPTPALAEACRPLHPVTFNHQWLLNQPEVHTLSCGPSRPEEVDRNLLAADYTGAGPERAAFDAVLARVNTHYRAALGETFCTVCHRCLPCPEDINIPDLLWNTHQRIETGTIRKPLWQHEGDLVARRLKQTPG